MSITGYANRFGPLRLAGIIAEQAYNVAGFLLNSGRPLDDDDRLRLIAIDIAADVRAIRKLLQTSAVAPVVHSPNPEDAAEAPGAATPPHYSEGRPGHLNVEDIPDEYWDCGMGGTR